LDEHDRKSMNILKKKRRKRTNSEISSRSCKVSYLAFPKQKLMRPSAILSLLLWIWLIQYFCLPFPLVLFFSFIFASSSSSSSSSTRQQIGSNGLRVPLFYSSFYVSIYPSI